MKALLKYPKDSPYKNEYDGTIVEVEEVQNGTYRVIQDGKLTFFVDEKVLIFEGKEFDYGLLTM